MKYFNSMNIFQYSWDQVTSSYWSRYPNPYSTHVLSEDVVEREVRDSQLVSKRIISKTNKLPRWGDRFIPAGAKSACVVEESVVDPATKTFTTYTRNIHLTKIMVCVEKCVYTPSTDNSLWTECHKEAWVDSSVYGFARAIQAFGFERFKKNANKASKGLDFILNKTYNPNIVPEHSPLLGKLPEKLKEKAQQTAQQKLAKSSVLTN